MSVDDVTKFLNRFGAQFFDICYVNWSLANKDKSPFTVPSVFTYQKNMRLIAESDTPSSPARVAQPQPRPDYHEVSGVGRLPNHCDMVSSTCVPQTR